MGIETREIVISPDSDVTPAQLKSKILSLLSSSKSDIRLKETCYGALIEGEADELKRIVDEVRGMDRNGIYTKPRGFPIGDPRICRATRQGGPRPGFHQLELEYSLLPKVREALDKLKS